jgi:hypothetical protein
MPPKQKQAMEAAADPQPHHQVGLLDLPAPVLAHVASYSKTGQPVPPLLAVSQACRDAALTAVREVTLTPRGGWDHDKLNRPLARLLHRACSLAPAGLRVVLDMPTESRALPTLFQPGIASGGWGSVHELEIIHVRCSQLPVLNSCCASCIRMSRCMSDCSLTRCCALSHAGWQTPAIHGTVLHRPCLP